MNKLITILGPTATGKTTLAANLAAQLNGEIISADSRQIYRGMDIGTGKDISDYTVNGRQITKHLIDIAEPGYRYSVFEFLGDFTDAYNKIINAGKLPILCGGSGMYLDAVIRGYNMGKVHTNNKLREQLTTVSHDELVVRLASYGNLHNTSDITDRERLIRAIEIAEYQSDHAEMTLKLPKFNSTVFGIYFDRPTIRKRITTRLEERLNQGMVKEVELLLNNGIKHDQLVYYGLEYKFVTMYVIGNISYDTMFEKLNIAIHRFAKRQMTWYRRMEKNGVKINWIDGNLPMCDKLSIISLINS
jgi:tRNA dimethylallyltransferase